MENQLNYQTPHPMPGFLSYIMIAEKEHSWKYLIMETNEESESQLSDNSIVLDLPFTFETKPAIMAKPNCNGRMLEMSGFGRLFETPPFSSPEVNCNTLTSQDNIVEDDVDFVKAKNDNPLSSHQRSAFDMEPGLSSLTKNVVFKEEKKHCKTDSSLRKSLDTFYDIYCQKKPSDDDTCSKIVLGHLSSKISDLRRRKDQKYALRSLQLAHIILNRDGCAILKTLPKKVNFTPLANPVTVFEKTKLTPGLSKYVLDVLLQQPNAT